MNLAEVMTHCWREEAWSNMQCNSVPY